MMSSHPIQKTWLWPEIPCTIISFNKPFDPIQIETLYNRLCEIEIISNMFLNDILCVHMITPI